MGVGRLRIMGQEEEGGGWVKGWREGGMGESWGLGELEGGGGQTEDNGTRGGGGVSG